uniref:Uncharacterized protein n=2 Tax=Oryza sativa subsp. japonica TaxID=39947 RepID=Q10EW9_ORYSJ|nr:hypothetical protein [Oryza sativa Japonica Group]ABF98297.1 hypothetical protein LOC_Os03g48529 [Oryza sativa Japonica Group]
MAGGAYLYVSYE